MTRHPLAMVSTIRRASEFGPLHATFTVISASRGYFGVVESHDHETLWTGTTEREYCSDAIGDAREAIRMGMALTALVPTEILRKWDRIAAVQLCEAASRLAEQNEELERRVYFAEDCADMWQRDAEIAREGGISGLTINGSIVRLDQSVGATIDDDPEYRGAQL